MSCQAIKLQFPNLKLGQTKVLMILIKSKIKDTEEEITLAVKTKKKNRNLLHKKKRKRVTNKNVKEINVVQRLALKALFVKSQLMQQQIKL